MCLCVYVGLDLCTFTAERAVEVIAGTDSDRPAEWELFSNDGFSECEGSEVNINHRDSLASQRVGQFASVITKNRWKVVPHSYAQCDDRGEAILIMDRK